MFAAKDSIGFCVKDTQLCEVLPIPHSSASPAVTPQMPQAQTPDPYRQPAPASAAFPQPTLTSTCMSQLAPEDTGVHTDSPGPHSYSCPRIQPNYCHHLITLVHLQLDPAAMHLHTLGPDSHHWPHC